jgi:hypothetical protein
MNFGDELKDGKSEVTREREEKLVERVHLWMQEKRGRLVREDS